MLQVLVLKVSEREAPGRAVHPLPCRGHPVGTRAKGFRMGSSWTLHINNGKSSFRGAPCSIGDVLTPMLGTQLHTQKCLYRSQECS